MIAPTSANVRSWSQVDFDEKGFPLDVPDPLDLKVQAAGEYLTYVTGRKFATMPAGLEATSKLVVQMRTEQLVMQAQADTVETAGDIDLIASFTAGAYSETRRDPAAAAARNNLMLNPWPALNELLWLLLGTTTQFPDPAVDERYGYWIQLLTGTPLPAWQVVEVDWAGEHAGSAISPFESWQRYF